MFITGSCYNKYIFIFNSLVLTPGFESQIWKKKRWKKKNSHMVYFNAKSTWFCPELELLSWCIDWPVLWYLVLQIGIFCMKTTNDGCFLIIVLTIATEAKVCPTYLLSWLSVGWELRSEIKGSFKKTTWHPVRSHNLSLHFWLWSVTQLQIFNQRQEKTRWMLKNINK